LLEPDQKIIISEAASISQNVEKKMIKIGDLKYIITTLGPFLKGRVNPNSITDRRLFNLKIDPEEKNELFRYPKYKQTGFDRHLLGF